jgi:hypothetical protein
MNASVRTAAATVFADPNGTSIKRVAWAFGCAKKDSDEEIALYRILLEKAASIGNRYVLALDLIAKLEREQYETVAPGHTELEIAGRRGWNQRAQSLIAELRVMLEGK